MNKIIHVIPTFVELISLAFCIGALVCRLWVYKNSLSGIWRLFGICIAAMAAGSIADLLVRALEMSGRPFQEILPVLPVVFLRTHYGHIWTVRIVSLIALGIAWATGKRARDSRAVSGFMLFLAAVFAFSESASGHASDAGDFTIPEIMDWLHLTAASVWGGGLFVLSAFILPKLISPGDERRETLIADVARRFSRIAGIAVGVVTITAFYNAWFSIRSFGALWNTPYGLTALGKILLLLVLLSLGAFNRYISVPILQQRAGLTPNIKGLLRLFTLRLRRIRQDEDGYRIAFRFKGSVKLEALLIIAVLLCAAILRHEIPARHLSHLQHHMESGTSMPSQDTGWHLDQSDRHRH